MIITYTLLPAYLLSKFAFYQVSFLVNFTSSRVYISLSVMFSVFFRQKTPYSRYAIIMVVREMNIGLPKLVQVMR